MSLSNSQVLLQFPLSPHDPDEAAAKFRIGEPLLQVEDVRDTFVPEGAEGLAISFLDLHEGHPVPVIRNRFSAAVEVQETYGAVGKRGLLR